MFLVSFADYLWSKKLQHMIVHVTNHCNFRCNHCFIDFSPKRDLKLEDYQRLSAEAGPLFWLDIGGGEPFLRKDLADIVAAFKAKVIQIPTNASLQDQILSQLAQMKRTVAGELSISMSLDGLEATHERIRKAAGNWAQVWDTFEKVRQLGGIAIKINTVVNQENFTELLPLMREVRSHKPDFHSIILLRGDPINPSFGLPPLDQLREAGPAIFEILGSYDYGKGGLMARLLRNYHKYLWNLSLSTLEQRTQVIPCLAGKAHAVVMGDGSVSSCEMLPPVGNIKDQSFDAIRASEAYRQQVRDIEAKKCFCTHNCAMFDSIFFSVRSVPQLLHQKVQT